jgi:hypothetical protein
MDQVFRTTVSTLPKGGLADEKSPEHGPGLFENTSYFSYQNRHPSVATRVGLGSGGQASLNNSVFS